MVPSFHNADKPTHRRVMVVGLLFCMAFVAISFSLRPPPESGQVLETRLVRGIDRPVGLNEAADQIVRRSTFSPPTKDGVRVKAWTTVPVDFKL